MSNANPSLSTLKAENTPGEFARILIERGKIFWWEQERFWVVTDYRAAEAMLKSPGFSANRAPFFIARMPHIQPQVVGDFFGVVQKMMVTSDAPEHGARRKLASHGLSDHVLDAFGPRVDETVRALVGKVRGRPRFEFVTELAQELPSIVLAELFSIAEGDRKEFYERSNNMTQFFGASSGCPMHEAVRANSAAAGLREFFTGLIAERRARPRQDFLSILLKHQASLGLDDSEVVSQAIMMLVAGKVTTTDQISNNMHALLTTPGLYQRLRSEPASLEAAIEEVTRLDPAVNFVFRVAKADIELGGVLIHAGEVVFVSIHAVNRDPELFADPNDCRLDRARNPHFSYGHGAHYCLGAKLARIQMKALFGALLSEFPQLALDSERAQVRKNQSLAFSGFEALHLRT